MKENDKPEPSLEERRFEAELKLKRDELNLRREELEFKQNEEKKTFLKSPLAITILTGVIGLISVGVGNFIQSLNNTELERKKAELSANLEREKLKSSLILKVIETGNSEVSSKNLLFLLELNLIDDPNGKISALKSRPQDAPVLPSGSNDFVPSTIQSRETFFKKYNTTLGGLTQEKKSNLDRILDFIKQDKDIPDIRYVAYILATISWETNDTFQPIIEEGTDSVLEQKYSKDKSVGKLLGNTQLGDGVRYKGRGYVQLAGKRNYQEANENLKLINTDKDLINFPDAALEPEIAYRIVSYQMINGRFTGKKLGDYITKEKTDYVSARRIVNGTDHAIEIAENAKKFEAMLRSSISQEKTN